MPSNTENELVDALMDIFNSKSTAKATNPLAIKYVKHTNGEAAVQGLDLMKDLLTKLQADRSLTMDDVVKFTPEKAANVYLDLREVIGAAKFIRMKMEDIMSDAGFDGITEDESGA